jgi:hypothetical protein
MAGDAGAPTPLRPLVALSPRAYSKILRADPSDELLRGRVLYRITTIIKGQLGSAGATFLLHGASAAALESKAYPWPSPHEGAVYPKYNSTRATRCNFAASGPPL